MLNPWKRESLSIKHGKNLKWQNGVGGGGVWGGRLRHGGGKKVRKILIEGTGGSAEDGSSGLRMLGTSFHERKSSLGEKILRRETKQHGENIIRPSIG